jgi:hypothetical protein
MVFTSPQSSLIRQILAANPVLHAHREPPFTMPVDLFT